MPLSCHHWDLLRMSHHRPSLLALGRSSDLRLHLLKNGNPLHEAPGSHSETRTSRTYRCLDVSRKTNFTKLLKASEWTCSSRSARPPISAATERQAKCIPQPRR